MWSPPLYLIKIYEELFQVFIEMIPLVGQTFVGFMLTAFGISVELNGIHELSTHEGVIAYWLLCL